MIERAHHVSLAVSNIERARRFYGEVLGLSEIARPDFGFPGAWYRVGELELHLIVPPSGTDTGTPPARPSPIAGHVALQVADYVKTRDMLRAQGVEVTETGVEVGQLFAADPDGNVVELIVPGGRLGRR